MKRKAFSDSDKVVVLARFGGCCAECGGSGPFEYDHIRPIWLGGLDHKNNLQPLCGPCHKAKTIREASERAKVKRIQSTDGLLKKRPNKRERFLSRRVLPV